MPVIAARSPSDAFECAIEACRIAVQYMTPVMLPTDGYIANAAEPWKVPDPASDAPFPVQFLAARNDRENLLPYKRDNKDARQWNHAEVGRRGEGWDSTGGIRGRQ